VRLRVAETGLEPRLGHGLVTAPALRVEEGELSWRRGEGRSASTMKEVSDLLGLESGRQHLHAAPHRAPENSKAAPPHRGYCAAYGHRATSWRLHGLPRSNTRLSMAFIVHPSLARKNVRQHRCGASIHFGCSEHGARARFKVGPASDARVRRGCLCSN